MVCTVVFSMYAEVSQILVTMVSFLVYILLSLSYSSSSSSYSTSLSLSYSLSYGLLLSSFKSLVGEIVWWQALSLSYNDFHHRHDRLLHWQLPIVGNIQHSSIHSVVVVFLVIAVLDVVSICHKILYSDAQLKG